MRRPDLGAAVLLAAACVLAPVLLPASAARAQSTPMARLTTADGLSQGTIQTVLQDHRGFVWIATSDGLNRYDGYDFTVYKHAAGDDDTPGSSTVTCLHEDPAGALWLCAANAGVDRFDPVTGTFTHYRHDPDDPATLSSNDATFIQPARDGRLWIGTQQNGLNRLDPATGRVERFPASPNGMSHFMKGLVEADDGTLWIAATLLLRLDPATGTSTSHFGEQIEGIRAMVQAGDGTLWLGTSQGLAHADPEAGTVTVYPPHPGPTIDASANHVDELLMDADGTFWCGTPGGLYRFDPAAAAFVERHVHDPADPGSLVGSAVHELYRDAAGLLWIGTADAGLSLLDPHRAAFTTYRHTAGEAHSLYESNVHAVHVDDDGVVWLGTSKGVVTRFDPEAGAFTHHRPDPNDPTRLPAGYFIRALARAPDGPLWIGGWNAGANRMEAPDGVFTRLGEGPGGLTSENVLSIHAARDGDVWIGTVYGGLNRYDPATGRVRAYRHDPDDPTSLAGDAVNVLYETRDGVLWAGTWTGGVSRYDRARDRFTTYRHDPDDPTSLAPGGVNAVLEGRDGTLWIGTLGGLNRFDPATETFAHVTDADGLASSGVQGLLEADDGTLWLSTRRGLSSYRPADGRVRNYDVGDGLPSDEFHDGAAARGPDGRLYFGTNKGLLVLDPRRLAPNRHVPPVVLTDLRILNEPVAAGTPRLPRALWATDTLTLTHDDVVFSLAFAALGYSAPAKHRYRYRLAGLESDWNDVGSRRREARYSSLPPGDYTFEVQAANADGVWNRRGARLHVAVLPPWWGTWWFRTAALVLGAGLLLGAVGWRLHAVERHRRTLARQVETRTHELAVAKDAAEAANRAKSAFLANMSHELRTPLNAVLGFTELMRQDARTPLPHRDHLDVVRRSGSHLLALINDVLDMSKVEAGRAAAEPAPTDLYDLLGNLRDLFALRARQKGLAFEVERPDDLPRVVETDERKLRQILLNLLSNALKFTDEGQVTMRAVHRDGRLVVTVEDTGPGIAEEEADGVFRPFVQTHAGRQRQEGTGLGLSISRRFADVLGGRLTFTSTPGAGTTFRLDVPAAVVTASSAPAPPPAPDGPWRLAAGSAPPRMLVVDDQLDNRRLLGSVLHAAGFDVRLAADGREALEVAAAWRPHLVWLDRRMPGLGGDEVARRLKAWPEPPVLVALTASSLSLERADLLGLGYDDYLGKPFEQHALFALAARHLDVRFEERAAANAPADGALDPDALRAQPPEWRRAFHGAVVRGHTAELERLARQIAADAPALSAALLHHVRSFHLELLLAAVDAAAVPDRSAPA